jgi:glucose/arabinose dehydrogenase
MRSFLCKPRFVLSSTLLLLGSGLTGLSCGSESSGTGSGGGGSASASTSTGQGSQSSTTGSSSSGGGQSKFNFDCSAPTGAFPKLKLTEIANVKRPMLIIGAPGDDKRLFILGQDGKIWVLLDGKVLGTPFLDISKLVHQPSGGDERGLLGLAFHPDYDKNRRFFVFYTDLSTAGGSSGNQVVAEYAGSDDPNVAKPGVVNVLFTEVDTESNHNGGMLAFSPKDGFLYIGMGDGGGGGDGHGTFGNGQNLATKWGKILRIDVASTPYAIPAGNITEIPAGNPTKGAVVKEIWDYGLRNPWRFSFDACSSDLYIGDVGQMVYEEIDVEPAGAGKKNYGWRLTEGNHDFNPEGYDKTGITPAVDEYAHTGGNCSVSGGYVYRGSAIPGLRGTYFYGDYCSGKIWAFSWKDGVKSPTTELTNDLDSAGTAVVSFGQDNNGEVYVVDLNGPVYRIDAE